MSCPFCTPSNRSEPVDLSEFYVDDDPDPAPSPASPAETREGRDGLIEAIEQAFSGDEYEENAAAAAGEGEWSWFRWLALSTVRAASPAPSLPGERPGGEATCIECGAVQTHRVCAACFAALPVERADEEGEKP